MSDGLRLPAEIGGYQIQRRLGSGGMATVYAALQKRPRRTVAIKVMRGNAAADTAIRRFRREIEFLGRLRHPYIAQIYDAGFEDQGDMLVPYFVMEYVPGARSIIDFADHRELSVRDRMKLFVKVCAAVEHGHRNKIIHRDLKPANILIDETGDPKIIDFGVARAIEPEVTKQTMQTEAGKLIGTVQYMSPEQLETTRQDLDRRTDVYSLGVLLFRLLTGRPTHDVKGLPLFTAVQVIREDEPPRPSSVRADLKGDIETIILKAMAKDRNRRYRSAASLGRDLVRFLSSKPIHAREASLLYRARLFAQRRTVELRAAIAVAVVVVIAAAIVLYQRAALTKNELQNEVTKNQPALPPVAAATPAVEADDDRTPVIESPTPEPRASVPAPIEVTMPWSLTTALAFDPTGTVLAAGAGDGSVGWVRVETGEVVRAQQEHDGRVTHLAYNADGDVLASAATDGTIALLNTTDGRMHGMVRHRLGRVRAMTLAPDAALVAFAGDDLTVRLVDRIGNDHGVLRGTRGGFDQLAFSPDGATLAGAAERGDVFLWDVEIRDQIQQLTGLPEAAAAVAFDPTGRRVLAITAGGVGRVWTVADGAPAGAFESDAMNVRLVSIDRTVDWFILVTSTGLEVRDTTAGLRVTPAPTRTAVGLIDAIALARDARRYAAVETGRAVIHLAPVAARW